MTVWRIMMKAMNRIRASLIGAILFLFCVPALSCAGSANLVSVGWLASHMKQKNLVVLDVSDFTHYEQHHIPGAVRAFGPWQVMSADFVGFMMPGQDQLVKMLRTFGVNNGSMVVVYDEGNTASDTAKSARALWTLHVLGHAHVAILNGGFSAWDRAGKKVTTQDVAPVYGNFTAKPVPALVATLKEVKKKIGSKKVVFLDNRGADEYFGQEKRSYIKRFGHLPGALLWPAKYMTNAGVDFSPSFFMNVKALRKMAKGVGIPADKNVEIITYSNQGLSAAMGYYVLHDLLGYRNVKLYDGSILQAAAVKAVPLNMNGWGFVSK